MCLRGWRQEKGKERGRKEKKKKRGALVCGIFARKGNWAKQRPQQKTKGRKKKKKERKGGHQPIGTLTCQSKGATTKEGADGRGGPSVSTRRGKKGQKKEKMRESGGPKKNGPRKQGKGRNGLKGCTAGTCGGERRGKNNGPQKAYSPWKTSQRPYQHPVSRHGKIRYEEQTNREKKKKAKATLSIRGKRTPLEIKSKKLEDSKRGVDRGGNARKNQKKGSERGVGRGCKKTGGEAKKKKTSKG